MRIVALVVIALGVACFKPTLDTCAGLACPDGKVCRVAADEPRCIPIAGCDKAAPGSACELGTGQEATCEGGACVAIERCGNGVVETNEACDCGDPGAALRPECNMRNNSADDPLAPCRTDCTLRSCGDGIRDGNEQCEGVTFAEGLTCGTFGYYEGELACSPLCIVDTAGCAGRCGDGTVDVEHEFCDTMSGEPPSRMCTDFGYATGRLGCSALCGPAFGECRDGTAFVELLPLRVIRDIAPGPAGQAWVALEDELLRYSGGNFISHPPLAANEHVIDLSSYGERAAISSSSNRVLVYDSSGVVETLMAPAQCQQIVLTAPRRLACFSKDGLRWWDDGTWGATLAGPVATDAIAYSDASVLYTRYDGTKVGSNEVYLATQSAITEMAGNSAFVDRLDYLPTGQAPTTGGYYGGLAQGGADYGLAHLNDETQEWQVLPGTAGAHAVANVGGRTIWSSMGHDEVRLPRWSAPTLDGAHHGCKRFVTTGASALCLTYGHDLWRFAGATIGHPIPVSLPAQIADAAVDDRDQFYFLTINGLGAGYPDSFAPPEGATFTTFVGVRGSQIAVRTRDGSAPSRVAIETTFGGWTQREFSTVIEAAALGLPDHVIVATPSGILCHVSDWNAATNELTRLDSDIACPSSLWVSPSGRVWAAHDTGVRDVTAGMDVLAVPAAASPATGHIRGIADDHIWFASAGRIWFWDGETWQQQLDEPDIRFEWLSASPHGVVASSEGSSRVTWTLTGATTSAPRWVKLRLPSDLTPMLQPQIRPWGIFYRTDLGGPRYAVWQDGWAN